MLPNISNDDQGLLSMDIDTDTHIKNSFTSKESLYSLNKDILEYEELFICMIDIVGFSNWCTLHTPKFIINKMIEYNNIINNILKKYDNVFKVELVGDCCMIVSNMCRDNNYCETKHNGILLLYFLNEFLFENAKNLRQKIFCSDDISFRVGLHVGYVYGTYLTNPCRFQLFSNEINIASRLESSAIPNTIHISNKASMILFDDQHEIIDNYLIIVKENTIIKGNKKTLTLKGVGTVQAFSLFLKKKCILIVDEMLLNLRIVEALFKNEGYIVETTTSHDKAFNLMKSFIYDVVVLDIFYGNTNCYLQLQEFRKWESIERTEHQKIIGHNIYKLDSNENNLDPNIFLLFDVHINKNDRYISLRKCVNNIINNRKNPKPRKTGMMNRCIIS